MFWQLFTFLFDEGVEGAEIDAIYRSSAAHPSNGVSKARPDAHPHGLDHRAASHALSLSTSSLRNFLKALAVLLLTVPMGMPVRSDISLWESPSK